MESKPFQQTGMLAMPLLLPSFILSIILLIGLPLGVSAQCGTGADVTPPTANCQNIEVSLDSIGGVRIFPLDIDDGSIDNCPNFTITINVDTFSCSDVGQQNVVLTIVDSVGLSDSCHATVLVKDDINPVPNLNAITDVFLDSSGIVVVVPTDIESAPPYDNCGISLARVFPNEFHCLPSNQDTVQAQPGNVLGGGVGTNQVVYLLTDVNLNNNFEEVTVNVRDTIVPVIVCQDHTLYVDSLGLTNIIDYTPGFFVDYRWDNCPTHISGGPRFFDCDDLGVNDVVITIRETHQNPNYDSCTSHVTVLDTILPEAIAKNQLTLYLDANGMVAISGDTLDDASVDNCRIDSFIASIDSFGCGDIQASGVPVLLTVVDGSGNRDTDTTAVIVLDTVSPTALCQNISVYLDGNGQVFLDSTAIDNGSSDACGIAEFRLDDFEFSCLDIGLNPVVMTVEDVNGNTSMCSGIVQVFDTLAPNAQCQDTIVTILDGAGMATVNPVFVNNGSGDNCALAPNPFSLSQTAFDCSHLGNNSAVLFVTDASGNTGNCTTTIKVLDNIIPIARCQDITVQVDSTGFTSINGIQLDNVSSDNCALSYTVNQDTFTCFNTDQPVSVTLTVTDASGNNDNCSALVTVEDTIQPIARCHDITLFLSGNSVTIDPNAIENGSLVACGIPTLSVNPPDLSCSQTGPNTVVLRLDAINGRSDSCTAVVTVLDTVSPIANCQNVILNLNPAGTVNLNAIQVNDASSDNCSTALSVSPNQFGCMDVGAQQVTLTVTDPSNNSATCQATVTIQDTTSPTALCQNINLYLDGSGNVSVDPNDLNNGSSDECGIALAAIPNAYSCTQVGQNTVSLQVADPSGNLSTCQATANVIDTVPPVAVCQDITVFLDTLTGTVNITGAELDNGSSDACGIDALTASPNLFTCTESGNNTVTLTATDENGNSATCTAIVTVEDTIPLNAVCQDITVFLDASGQVSITPADLDGGSNAACGIDSLVLNRTNFACVDTGQHIVTLTITDMGSQSASCSGLVTVVDQVPPTLNCQNLTLPLDSSGSASILLSDVLLSATDACGIVSQTVDRQSFACTDLGANSLTVTVEDVNGNISTCSPVVTVVDQIFPVVLCKDTVTLALDIFGNTSIGPADLDNGSFDNCSFTLDVVPDSLSCAEIGPNNVVLTATDSSGNASTCTSTVIVVDNIALQANCQNITIDLDAGGNASITAQDIDGGSTAAACQQPTISLDVTNFNCSNLGPNTVTLTLTDLGNNSSSCQAIVTVRDVTPPNAVCSSTTVYLDQAGNGSITGLDVNNGSTDACGVENYQVFPNTFSCAEAGANNQVTLTVTDSSGNASNCTANITVADTVAPIAQCQPVTRYLDAIGNASLSGSDLDNGSTDACGIDSLIAGQTQFGCADVGTNGVTLTVIDNQGNTANCISQVTIFDTIAPNAICQNIIVNLTGGNATILPGDVDNQSSDACTVAQLSLDQTSFNCTDIGPNQVTLTVTDANGNSDQCNATVTVHDLEAPVAVCQNATVYLNSGGAASLVPADIDGGSTDACGIDSLAVFPNNFGCTDVSSPQTVSLSVGDVNGNFASCTASVTVHDTTPPLAVCQALTVQLLNGNATIAGSDLDGGSVDNCAIASLVATPAGFNCANVGPNTVTLTVTDLQGNLATCTTTVTVEDNEAPDAQCMNAVIYLDSSVNANLPASAVDNGSSDACGIANQVVSPATFTCTEVGGANTVSLLVTDTNGNQDSCQANVTVLDTVAPLAQCQTVTLQLDQNGQATLNVSQLDNGSNDQCGVMNLTASPSSFDCSNVGQNSVTLTVTDLSNNSAQCTAIVTVEDVVPPNMVCKNITVPLSSSGSATITASDVDNGSSDACGLQSLSVNPNNFNCSNLGPQVVTLIGTDVHNNSDSCAAIVTVEDLSAPVANCQNITVQLLAGQATITGNDIDNGSADACGIASLTVSPSSFSCANLGANLVTLVVADSSGNNTSCTATVTVEDNEPPTPVCQNITVYLDGNGQASITSSDIDNGSSDPCGIQSLAISQSNFSCVDTGANAVILTVTDLNQNTAACTATVTVLDTISPVITTCPPDQFTSVDSTSCLASVLIGMPNATDNCSIDSILNNFNGSTDASGNYPLGSTVVVWTVSDVNGNTTNCETEILVTDAIAPVAVCRDTTLYLNAEGNAFIATSDIDGGSFDNCGLALQTASPNFFTCANIGQNPVVLTVVDESGNQTSCTAMVTVVDTVAPVANCQNITVRLDVNGQALLDPAAVSCGSTDDCGIASQAVSPAGFDCSDLGIQSGTLTVTDNSGNTAACTFTATVLDTEGPVIANCPASQTVVPGTANCTPEVFWTAPTATDNCSGVTLTSSHQSGDQFPIGTTTVIYTATDSAGNVSLCTFDIVVDPPGNFTISVSSPTLPCGQNIACHGGSDGSATATVAGGCLPCGGYNYLWSNGQTTATATNLIAGTYTVTVTGDNNNPVVDTITLTQPAPLVVTGTASTYSCGTNISCAGAMDGTIDLTVTGGANCGAYQFAWSGPNGFTSNSEDLTNLIPGNYDVVVTDTHGCVATLNLVLTEPAPLQLNLVAASGGTISCNGAMDGAIDLSISGGASCQAYTIQWTGPMGFTAATEDLNNLGPGTYTVTVTDTNGCTATGQTTLTTPTALSSTISSPTVGNGGGNVTCNSVNGSPDGSATIVVSGGTPPYTYLWSNGQTSATATSLNIGLHTVTVTDQNGCTLTDSISLTGPDPLIIDAGGCATVYTGYSPTECTTLEASIATGGTPPYSYLWNTSDTSRTITVCPTSTTVYSITVTDANGCEGIDSVTVNVVDASCGNKGNKVLVCHIPPGNPSNPQQICIGAPGVGAHVSGGYGHAGCYVGPCGQADPCANSSVRMAPGSAAESMQAEQRQVLLDAFPNPFGTSTTINFMLMAPDHVEIRILDVHGHEIALIYDAEVAAFEPQQLNYSPKEHTGGQYFVNLRTRSGNSANLKLIQTR